MSSLQAKRWAFIEEWAHRYPLRSFSVSSMNLYRRCPESWRRKYLDEQYEPRSGPMLAGSAAWAAVSRSYFHKLATGDDLPVDHVLDVFAGEWAEMEDRETPVWSPSDEPGKVKDRSASALRIYQQTIAPTVRPLAVERQFRLVIDRMPWVLKGYVDLERLPGRRRRNGSVPCDGKLSGKRISQDTADRRNQVDCYLTARRAEGDPSASFEFHLLLRQATPAAEIVATHRTDAQLDQFLEDALFTAALIARSAETGAWDTAPPEVWWCSQRTCGFFDSCPQGGLHIPVRPEPEEITAQ